MTLRQALLERPNSLNLVRLFLASSVVLGHAWPIGNAGDVPGWALPFATLPVPLFFCLSGFLIAHSRMRVTFGRFMWHRALRIAPALWAVLLVTAFVAAPISVLGGGSWSPAAAKEYVLSNALVPYGWSLSGTIDGEPWNGSLWTLPYEVVAYVFAGLLLSLSLVRRHAVAAMVATYLAAAVCVWSSVGIVTSHLETPGVAEAYAAVCFLAGMVLYFISDRIRADARFAAFALALISGLWAVGLDAALGALPLAYLALWLGAAIPARWAQRNDISYGVYVYAFPVQVLLEWFAPGLSVAAHVVAALAVTVPLAWASWVLIERPALRLRHLGARVVNGSDVVRVQMDERKSPATHVG